MPSKGSTTISRSSPGCGGDFSDEDKKIIEYTAAGVRSHYFKPGPCAPMEHNELRLIKWYLEELQLARRRR